MRLGVLNQLELDTEFEGYTPGTPQVRAVLQQKKVETCLQMKGLGGCDECEAFDGCEIVKGHLRDLHFGVSIKP